MDIQNIISFLAASVVLTFMPGPDNIYVLIESITKGYKTGIAISAGLVSGIFIHTFIAATGLSILLKQSEFIYSFIKFAGAAYLWYLAIMAYRENSNLHIQNNDKIPVKFQFQRLYVKGFLMNVMNPKVTLFFIAFLPQFISSSGLNIEFQMIILGLIFMIQAILIFSLIAILAGRISQSLQYPLFWKVTKWIKVVILIILGFYLIVS